MWQMGRLRIGFDVDDVLNNFMEVVVAEYNKHNDDNLTLGQFTKYKIDDCLPPEKAELVKKEFKTENIWEKIVPTKTAQTTLERLIQKGYLIYLVTACDPITHPIKSGWIKKWFPFIPQENVVYTYNKWLLNVDILVDDCQDHLVHGIYTRVLMDKPWNRNVSEMSYEYRISDVSELENFIGELEGGSA